MSLEFAGILQGLMDNRNLSARTVAKTAGLALATINRLLSGQAPPKAEVLRDIAPVLRMPPADLLVIAGLDADSVRHRPGPYAASAEIGHLISISTWLTSEQLSQVVDLAADLKARNSQEPV